MGKKTRKKRQRKAREKVSPVRVGLSLCMIVRDEAAFLERCLQSVQGLADEIVVVDTGSTDATPQVARQYGARVVSYTWEEDFSAARNRSLEAARGEWILVLDCDEAIAAQDHRQIRQAMVGEELDAFRLTTRNYTETVNQAGWVACSGEYAEEKGYPGWFPTTKVRLWRNRPEIRFAGVAHELVEPSILAAGGEMADCLAPVHHYGYVEKDRSRDEYLEAGQRKVSGNPQDLRAGYELAIAYRNAGRLREARDSIERVIAGMEKAPLQMRLYVQDEFALLVHADILKRLELPAEALAAYERILARFPRSFQALNNMGSILERQGRLAEARRCYAQGAAIAPDNRVLAGNLARLNLLPADASANPRLSLCMIVRDEESRLPGCLESVQGLVDEVVVVDTGSTDRTVEVAERFGARLGHFAWCDDFAAARNESLRLATGEWILWLDADDRLPAEEHAKIRQLLGRGTDKGYFFVLDDQGYEQVSCLQLRLFPNVPGVEFELPIHEQVTPSLCRLGLELTPTTIRVLHTGYSTPQIVQGKKERYLKIMERWLETHPDSYIVRSHVALTYYAAGRLDEAIAAYRQILYDSACLADRNYVVYTTALLFLGRSYLKKGDLEQALDYVRQAEKVDPDYILTKFSLAEIHLRREEFAQALGYAQRVLEGDRSLTFFPIDFSEVHYSAQIVCGKACQGLGKFEPAEQAFRLAAHMPVARRSEALGSLSELFKARQDFPRALEALQEACRLAPDHLEHVFNIGALYLERRELDKAVEYFTQVVERAPASAPALLNLGYIAKVKGQFEDAERFYRQAMRHDAAGIEARANLGHLLLELERFDEARPLFAEVRQRQPGLVDVELGLLVVLCQAGDWHSAADLMAELLDGFPQVERQLDNLFGVAQTLVRLGADLVHRNVPQCAEFAFWGAVLLDSDFAAARRVLAEVQFAQGKYWKAIAQYEAVLLANPQDLTLFARLGDCYRQLGVEEAALLCYARSGAASQP